MSPTELIQKLEAAKEGSRELDAEIYLTSRMGFSQQSYNNWTGLQPKGRGSKEYDFALIAAPKFTTSLDAALTLVPEDLSLAVKSPGFQSLRKTFLVELESDDYQWCGEGWNPALALCIAALRAREAGR